MSLENEIKKIIIDKKHKLEIRNISLKKIQINSL